MTRMYNPIQLAGVAYPGGVGIDIRSGTALML